jgi:DNA-binding transcriptional ArsR family regulator
MPDPQHLNAVFHALSDEKRREMLARLSQGALSVKDLAQPLGMGLPSAVKHLAILESGGLVTSLKSGRVRTYMLKDTAFDSISRWIADRDIALTAAFDRLDRAIAQFPEDTAEDTE